MFCCFILLACGKADLFYFCFFFDCFWFDVGRLLMSFGGVSLLLLSMFALLRLELLVIGISQVGSIISSL